MRKKLTSVTQVIELYGDEFRLDEHFDQGKIKKMLKSFVTQFALTDHNNRREPGFKDIQRMAHINGSGCSIPTAYRSAIIAVFCALTNGMIEDRQARRLKNLPDLIESARDRAYAWAIANNFDMIEGIIAGDKGRRIAFAPDDRDVTHTSPRFTGAGRSNPGHPSNDCR